VDGLEATKDRLKQHANLARLKKLPPITEMLTVMMVDRIGDHLYYLDCQMVPNSSVEECLQKTTIEQVPEQMMPGATRYHHNGQSEVVYHRFGNGEGRETLVLERHFHNLHPDSYEISEEFRYFHNLYHDNKTNRYYKVDEAGNDELVAIISEDTVQIRMREIRQFLGVKDMHLVVQFDFREHSSYKPDELAIVYVEPDLQREGLCCWDFSYNDIGMPGTRACSRLLGKILVTPLPKEKCGIWGFQAEKEEEYADFIFSVDENGDEIKCTGKPQDMGSHALKPQYLTQVHFKKTVLDKYYEQPSKYSVEDGYLRCGALWGLMMDNHHTDKVCAWLGDLGRDLPYAEQLHWRAHNIPPSGGMSETFLRRQIWAEFANSKSTDHLFREAYEKLQKTSTQKLGWPILIPPVVGDLHYLHGLRIPSTNEQKNFDEQILNLTKVLIDYLNEKELQKLVDKAGPELKPGGINLLERVCIDQKIAEADAHISLLREVQQLRSKGTAHRKGSEYQKVIASSGGDQNQFPAIFARLLKQAIEYLSFLEEAIDNGGFAKAVQP
jgi:hypothetical protein